MRYDRESDDPVVEVNFGNATLREPVAASTARGALTSLPDLLRLFDRRRWTILGVTLAVLAGAVVYLLAATPMYEATLVLQMEDRRQKLTGLEDLSDYISEGASPAETEMEIIRSRTVAGVVVDELGLDVRASPRRAPIIGGVLARRWAGPGVAGAPLGLERYAWGGERIRVRRLAVGEELVDEALTLTALQDGRFRLARADGAILVEGTVGAEAAAGEGAGRVELVLEELVARPGTEFVLTKRDRARAVSALLDALRVRETAKKTNVLVAQLEGAEPKLVSRTLNAVAQAYLRRNVERKSAETGQMLAFLQSQLPTLKANVDKAEAELNAFQREKQSIGVTQEAEAFLGSADRIETALQELRLQLADLRQRFTENHPSVVAVQQKIARMQAERATIEAQMKGLPSRELDLARLTRDVKVASELYVLVLNKAQELGVARSGVVGNVTIVDPAEPPRRPSRPNRAAVLVTALLLGLGLGVASAFAKNALAEGSDDPDEIEARTGLPVFVMVPHSEVEARLDREAHRVPGAFRLALAEAAPDDAATENLRSLRTALQFALVESRNNIIALGAPAPGVGKSFVAVNLAHLVAAAGRRVLVIDGDLRRGRLHRYFSLERGPGLSDVVSGAVPLDEALRHTGVERLDVLSTGRIPPNPAELLASSRFQQLLAAVSQRYDLVIVDTPPVLAVTDPALIARHAGVNLLVLRAGAHSVQEIVLASKQLAQAGVRIQGAILNEVQSMRGRYGRSGRYQQYRYPSAESDPPMRQGVFRRRRS